MSVDHSDQWRALVDQRLDFIEKNTRDLVELFNNARATMKFIESLGKLAKPLFWLVITSAFMYGMWSNIKTAFKSLI